ncbi:MAG: hydrogenase maturation protease [Nitrospirae bacterium]|nr:MAG: hydrogenase maturation protease [Nitrospirota bacterium]
MKTIVIGLGNPILTDDSVGIKIARELKARLSNDCEGVEIVELYAGGIRLIDVLAGYDKAIIVDAMLTGEHKPGTIHRFSSTNLTSTRNAMSMHDLDLPGALELGRMLGIRLPEDFRIWGIEADDVETFSEELTHQVACSVRPVVEEVMEELLTLTQYI